MNCMSVTLLCQLCRQKKDLAFQFNKIYTQSERIFLNTALEMSLFRACDERKNSELDIVIRE